MQREMTRRRGGPTLNMIVDIFQNARWTKTWIILLILVITISAAVAAFVGQTVLPWAIYPAR